MDEVAHVEVTAIAARMVELKKELQRLVKSIVDDEKICWMEAIDEAKEKLFEIKELKMMRKRSSSLSLKLQKKIVNFPKEIKCLFSKELMSDPIIVASGEVSLEFYFCLVLPMTGSFQIHLYHMSKISRSHFIV